jgi:hypothetical protein
VFRESNDYFETNPGLEWPLEWPTTCDERATTVLIHRVIFRDHPLAVFVLGGDGEKFRVGTRLASAILAIAAIVKDRQWRRALPLGYVPGKQRVLRLGIADEVCILLAVVMLPLGEQLIAMAVAKFVQKLIGAVLNGAVAQRVHPDAHGQTRQRIMIFGARQHRSLIAQPPDVAEKSKHHQRRDANSNTDLYASEPHPERKFIWSATSRKITAGSRDGTCTYGESGRPGSRFLRSALGFRPSRNDRMTE